MLTSVCCVSLLVLGCVCAPADDPVRIDLPVYNPPEAPTDSTAQSNLYEPENHPSVNTKSSGLFANKVQATSNLLDNKISFHPGQVGGILSAPVTTLEGAIMESEGYGSKILSVKENAQNTFAGIFQPKPLVDTIEEEEKYGNEGDKFYSAGRAIVGGASGISNLINSALEVPGAIIKKITRAATEKLNNLGGRLIGL